jgi:uncharacterized tellurite resistance protein B-like protein
MSTPIEFESFQEFVIFLCIYIAHSDGEYHPEEERVILSKVKKFFPDTQSPKALLDEANHRFRQFSPTEMEAIIEEGFRQFNYIGFHEKYRVFRDLYEIIHADGVVHAEEEEAIEKLKKIINYEVLG